MSQDITTNERTKPLSSETIPLEPWSAETYAEKLMDDLFSDIDRILEGGGKLPTEPAKPEYVSLQPVKVTPFASSATVVPLVEVMAPQSDRAAIAESPPPKQEIGVAKASSKSSSSDAPPRRSGQFFDKLLLVATCISLLATLILWFANRERRTWLFSLYPAATPVAQNTPSPADAQFINYMLRSLEAIERKTQASKPATNTGTPIPQAAMPSIAPQPPASNNLSPVPNSAPTVMERVYIQMPPIAPPALTPIPRASVALPTPPRSIAPQVLKPPVVIPPSPKVSVAPQTPRLALPSPAVSATPKSIRSPIARTSAAPAIPATPVAPVPSVLPSLAATPVAEAKHTLVGLMYLGDRSAALFDISGVTQRIQVGEPIGSSGWTLVAVTKEEAIIRRNGEVRSIYTGQKF